MQIKFQSRGKKDCLHKYIDLLQVTCGKCKQKAEVESNNSGMVRFLIIKAKSLKTKTPIKLKRLVYTTSVLLVQSMLYRPGL